MKIVVDSPKMKSIEDFTINEIGVPSLVLMERAALAVADCLKSYVQNNEKILAICGVGNNGADGIGAARILKLQGYIVDILVLGDKDKASSEFKIQINIAKNLGMSIYNNVNLSEYSVIIDAMLGIGLNKSVKGDYLDCIQTINRGKHTVFSVDIPSALSANTGKPLDVAVKANYTVTFGYNKIGLILYPGCKYAGEVRVVDIGFPKVESKADELIYYTYDVSDLNKLPKRENNSHKGDYGKVLVIAGSIGMNGACYLSAKAAYRTGAGLVKTLIPEDNRISMQTMLAEAILSTYISGNGLNDFDRDKVLEDISWASVIVIGPGLGTASISRELLKLLISNTKVPVIIDADGINILSYILDDYIKTEDKLATKPDYDLDSKRDAKANAYIMASKRINILKNILPKNTVLTPHMKELSRLLKIPLVDIKDDIIKIADICTKDNSLTFVLKDARTIVAYEKQRFINTAGNNGMATGGSGDVLSGIIASLIGQGIDVNLGAVLGVYVHGLAGDLASNGKSKYSIIASDIIEYLGQLLPNWITKPYFDSFKHIK